MLKENIATVQARIKIALAHRKENKLTGNTVKLVAVTKNHPVTALVETLALGVVDIGENRVQEAREKKAILPQGGVWHLLGHLQTNKTKQAVELFELIESVDSTKILQAIDREAEKQGKIQDVLLELNLAEEEQKTGLSREAYRKLVPLLSHFTRVRVRGLMVIAKRSDDAETTRNVFRAGYEEFCALQAILGTNCDTLSMGMTHDYWIAIEEGSNSIRVGTALFGAREYPA
ncbi:MAG: YggS family pyridoxal phosphate-dependent enzyme [Acidaminococcaceae bacterium]